MSATASDRKDRGFAYVALVCPEMEQPEVAEWSYKDILSAFLQGEVCASNESEMWPYGWGSHMRRVAPVQSSGALDLRNELLRMLGSPRFRFDHPSVYGGSVMYFSKPSLRDGGPEAVPPGKDAARFVAVLRASAELAARREQGLLFVGGWGWDYETELAAEQQVMLMEAGFPFVDRRVP